MAQDIRISVDEKDRRGRGMEGLLDDLGWGSLLVSVGVLWLIPEGLMPRGTWMIAAGLILLLFNAAHYLQRLPVGGLSLAVGTLALIAGIGTALDIHVPMFPIGLIVIGFCMLIGTRDEGRDRSANREHETYCR